MASWEAISIDNAFLQKFFESKHENCPKSFRIMTLTER